MILRGSLVFLIVILLTIPVVTHAQRGPTATPIPDSDGDGLPDDVDGCPNQPGPRENNGCPLPTATNVPPTPTLVPDSDGDGLPDNVDGCPNQPGPQSNNGCPLPAPTDVPPQQPTTDQPAASEFERPAHGLCTAFNPGPGSVVIRSEPLVTAENELDRIMPGEDKLVSGLVHLGTQQWTALIEGGYANLSQTNLLLLFCGSLPQITWHAEPMALPAPPVVLEETSANWAGWSWLVSLPEYEMMADLPVTQSTCGSMNLLLAGAYGFNPQPEPPAVPPSIMPFAVPPSIMPFAVPPSIMPFAVPPSIMPFTLTCTDDAVTLSFVDPQDPAALPIFDLDLLTFMQASGNPQLLNSYTDQDGNTEYVVSVGLWPFVHGPETGFDFTPGESYGVVIHHLGKGGQHGIIVLSESEFPSGDLLANVFTESMWANFVTDPRSGAVQINTLSTPLTACLQGNCLDMLLGVGNQPDSTSDSSLMSIDSLTECGSVFCDTVMESDLTPATMCNTLVVSSSISPSNTEIQPLSNCADSVLYHYQSGSTTSFQTNHFLTPTAEANFSDFSYWGIACDWPGNPYPYPVFTTVQGNPYTFSWSSTGMICEVQRIPPDN